MKKSKFAPESLMMSHGYRPEWSEGSVKPPIFQTSTFAFNSAEEGKAFFEVAYGLREKFKDEDPGLIYSRLNNPNLEILENRLCLWDKAQDCAVFSSGMSAISTSLLEFLEPGDLLLYSTPVYGGTEHFIHEFLPGIGIHTIPFSAKDDYKTLCGKIIESGYANKLAAIYLESPANPTNDIIDIEMCKRVADRFANDDKLARVIVDNTYMGPIWSNPLKYGADVIIYSATKYLGGHSDLIAGAVLGSHADVKRVKSLRTFLGNMPDPQTCWLLTRSLETLKVRMEQQMKNANEIAHYLVDHPAVESVHYLGLLNENDLEFELYKKQYSSPGAMISVDLKGGECEAFVFLNNLHLFKLAVSLGSTESLAQHPYTMTHAGIEPLRKEEMGITENMVRLSVGIENVNDLISDIKQALDQIGKQKLSEKEIMSLI